MNQERGFRVVRIRKRPWYLWLAWALFAAWTILWLEFCVGSWQEMEFRAFWLSIKVLLGSLILGVILWRIEAARSVPGTTRFKE